MRAKRYSLGFSMIVINANATVTPDGKLTVEPVRVPANVVPGEHKVVLQINERPSKGEKRPPIQFSSHDVGPWPEGLTLSREEIYDDD